LRTGGEYRREHVERLRKQIVDCDLVCISDDPEAADLPMLARWPGWWAKMELFNPAIAGDVFAMDLDTTVLGRVGHYATAGATTFLSDFYRPEHIQSSMMYLSEKNRRAIWEQWSARPEGWIAEYSKRRVGFNGDQNFIEDVIGPGCARWQQLYPGEVISYKLDIIKPKRATVPPLANVIIFHGRPRPWSVGL